MKPTKRSKSLRFQLFALPYAVNGAFNSAQTNTKAVLIPFFYPMIKRITNNSRAGSKTRNSCARSHNGSLVSVTDDMELEERGGVVN